jgi:hypothetical protein
MKALNSPSEKAKLSIDATYNRLIKICYKTHKSTFPLTKRHHNIVGCVKSSISIENQNNSASVSLAGYLFQINSFSQLLTKILNSKTMNNISEYVAQTAQLIDLPINPEYREAVISNLEQIAAIAQLITEFPLSDKIEIAPVFNPDWKTDSTPNL